MSRIRPGRTLTAVLLGTALLAGGATTADAARPHPARGHKAHSHPPRPYRGATYRGKIKETYDTKVLAVQPIAFTVDPEGKTVSNFILQNGYPVYCRPSGIGEAISVTVKIRHGAFRAILPIKRGTQRQGSVTVAGTFARHGLESGKVVTHFLEPRHANCNGIAQYRTKVKPKK